LDLLSSSNDLESFFTSWLWQVNRQWGRSFVYDNLLRLWSSLADHDGLRSRLGTVVVLRLTLVSLELIRFLTTLSRNTLLDPDIGLPNVPLRLSAKIPFPWTVPLWLAAVPLVDHSPRALRSFVAQWFT
jgi:hypothetical protein